VVLAHPPAADTLRDFPRVQVKSGWRLHRREFPPEFYFRGPYRFMPARAASVGVFHLATTVDDALAEAVEPGTVVSSAYFEDRILSELDLSGIEFANLQSRFSLSFGMSPEISVSPDYSWGQEWASALADAGFGGVAFPSRRVPGSTLVAVFGEEGPAGNLRIISQLTITSDDLQRAGITAVAGPATSGLDPL
jgi:hypothetical protein